jgi:hypothetical protein
MSTKLKHWTFSNRPIHMYSIDQDTHDDVPLCLSTASPAAQNRHIENKTNLYFSVARGLISSIISSMLLDTVDIALLPNLDSAP